MSNRVVVTGIGVVTPIGNNSDEFCQGLFSMKSGAGPIKRFDPAELPTRIACEVKGVEGEFRDVKITFALKAAREAVKQAFPNGKVPANSDSILSMGIGLELFSVDDLITLHNQGYDNVADANSLTFLNTPSDICAHLICQEAGINHSPLLHISACAAGTDAIGTAYLKIKSGKTKVALAGGTDSMINPMGIAGFCRITAMTTKNDTPQTASMPFDEERDGFVIGEGAGFLVLENETHAKQRGAQILGFIAGYGNSLDAYSISDPHPEGAGALKSMGRALSAAGLRPQDISAINAHGTGTPKNDPAEAQAIRSLLGLRYKEVPVFATKSLIGHGISSAGAVETVACILSFQENKLHATKNLKKVAPGCELHHIFNNPIAFHGNYILKNSFGFGGQNGSLVVGRWEN